MNALHSLGLKLENEALYALDQQMLPHQEIWFNASDPEVMIQAIQALKVRGAPLIGVAAALCLGLAAKQGQTDLLRTAQSLRAARPTAVNLMWAIDRLLPHLENPERLWQEALLIFKEDQQLCHNMGEHGNALIEDGDGVLTHCNTGGLATVGIGTALGVIRSAWESGKKLHVYVDETRPLLQGGRLTSWELEKYGIPYTLISDSMAAILMREGQIQKVFVGADRIARNGDFANKVGTYNVAVQAHYHTIPFYTVAPYSTVDLACPNGQAIPIEQRSADEIRGVQVGEQALIWAPYHSQAFNPSFDVTPVELLSGLICDQGLFGREALQQGILSTLSFAG